MIERAFESGRGNCRPTSSTNRRALYRQAFQAGWQARADAAAFKMWLAMRTGDDMDME
jgi:hypothetical protein